MSEDVLSDEIREKLRANAEKWRIRASQCFEVDRAEAEEGFRVFYESINLPPPKKVAWAGSPLSVSTAGPICALFESSLEEMRPYATKVHHSIESIFAAAVRKVLGEMQFASYYRDTVVSSIWDVIEHVCDGVFRNMPLAPFPRAPLVSDEEVNEAVAEIVEAVDDVIRRLYGRYNAGHLWGTYAAYVTAMRDIMHNDENPKATVGVEKITTNSGWWWPSDTFVIASPRPVRLSVDEQNLRFHNESEAAMEWPDGFRVYIIDGVRVPRIAVEDPASITVEMIKNETNSECRRILIDRMGPGRYLLESKAEIVDVDGGNPRASGSAPRVLLRDFNKDLWLVGTDGTTARVYHMPVPAGVSTCVQAHEAISGLKEAKIISEA